MVVGATGNYLILLWSRLTLLESYLRHRHRVGHYNSVHSVMVYVRSVERFLQKVERFQTSPLKNFWYTSVFSSTLKRKHLNDTKNSINGSNFTINWRLIRYRCRLLKYMRNESQGLRITYGLTNFYRKITLPTHTTMLYAVDVYPWRKESFKLFDFQLHSQIYIRHSYKTGRSTEGKVLLVN